MITLKTLMGVLEKDCDFFEAAMAVQRELRGMGQEDYGGTGTAKSAACRRVLMELTCALAEFRRSK